MYGMTASLPSRLAIQSRVRIRGLGRFGVAPLAERQLREAGGAVGVLLHGCEPLVEGSAVALVLEVLEPDVGSGGHHGRGM
jgi:hypothetical protein